jgi:hypothetical protein
MAGNMADSADISVISSKENNGTMDMTGLPFHMRIQAYGLRQWNSFRRFVYDAEHQTIIGATSSTWLRISIYYFFFYVCLAAFYCGMVAVFGAVISRESPRYTYVNSEMSADGNFHIGE